MTRLARPLGILAVCIVVSRLPTRGGADGECRPDDESSARAKRQVEMLMNEGLPFAERMLQTEGEFLPFGAVRVHDGPIRVVGLASGTEQPDAADVLERLLKDLRQGAQRREYDAIAVFANVEIPRPADGEIIHAVFVGLEHLDGYCADVFFPYSQGENGVELGQSFAAAREGSVFGSCR